MTSSKPVASEIEKRETIRVTLDFISGQVDKLAEMVTAWRDDAEGQTKSDFRAIGKRVESALMQLEKAEERL